jgi:hypothetical protein
MKENEGMSDFISQTSEDLAFLSSNFNRFLSLKRSGTGKAPFGR